MPTEKPEHLRAAMQTMIHLHVVDRSAAFTGHVDDLVLGAGARLLLPGVD